MVKYGCDKCGKVFRHKNDHSKHVNRKTQCGDMTLIKCENCSKLFKHKSSMYHHKKTCCSLANISASRIENISQKIQTNNIQNNNVNVDGNVSVNVVKFGDENLSYISDDLYKQILGRGLRAVEEFIEHSHFNKKHPENHNLYVANIRDEYLVLYDGDKWIITKRNEKLEDIIYAKSDYLYEKFKQLYGTMDIHAIQRFQNFLNLRDDLATMARIKEDLTMQLYNNRKLPQQMRRRMEILEDLELRRSIQTSLNNGQDGRHVITRIEDLLNSAEDPNNEVLQKFLASIK